MLDVKQLNEYLLNRKNLIVGVSGGLDSMVLLHSLWSYRNKIKHPFTVVHVDHQLSTESYNWAQFVKNWCDENKVNFILKKVSLEGLGNNLEFAARKARYAAFVETGADAVILAHHADDQIETMFMKLLRGSGLKGLKGMSETVPCWYDNNVLIVRPLLSKTRYQLAQYADENEIDYVTDQSNSDLKYDRNWIRHSLWPTIKQRYEIADINVSRTIKLLSESWQLTQDLAKIDLAFCLDKEGYISWPKLKTLDQVRIKNLILYILDIEGIQNFSANHIERFSQGLSTTTFDGENELRLSDFVITKHGKKITWRKLT